MKTNSLKKKLMSQKSTQAVVHKNTEVTLHLYTLSEIAVHLQVTKVIFYTPYSLELLEFLA